MSINPALDVNLALRDRTDRAYQTPPWSRPVVVLEAPDRAAGRFMLDLLGIRVPFWNVFRRGESWSTPEARRRAHAWVTDGERRGTGGPLLLVGPRVCGVFGLDGYEWLEWYRGSEHAHPMIPVPGRRSQWWTPERRDEARGLCRAVAYGKLPYSTYVRFAVEED